MKALKVISIIAIVIVVVGGIIVGGWFAASNTNAVAARDRTRDLELAGRNKTRAEVLMRGYNGAFYNRSLNLLSFHPQYHPGMGLTATCWEVAGFLQLAYKMAVLDYRGQIAFVDRVINMLDFYRGVDTEGNFTGYYVARRLGRNATRPRPGVAYDDVMWLVRDFIALHELALKNNDSARAQRYLDLAIESTDFLIDHAYAELDPALFDGFLDQPPGEVIWEHGIGGFYWDTRHDALHTCSNGPAAQHLAALYRVTEGMNNVPRRAEYKARALSTYNLLMFLEYHEPHTYRQRIAPNTYIDHTFPPHVFSDLMRFDRVGVECRNRPGCEERCTCRDCEDVCRCAELNADGTKKITRIGNLRAPMAHSYNVGAPMTAAVELYRLTGEQRYLDDLERWAVAAGEYFFTETDTDGVYRFSTLTGHKGNMWQYTILLNGYMLMAELNTDLKVIADRYIARFQRSMDFAYENFLSRGFLGINRGLLPTDLYNGWGEEKVKGVWSLNAAANAEIFASLAIWEKGLPLY
jgi:hypothetical protein